MATGGLCRQAARLRWQLAIGLLLLLPAMGVQADLLKVAVRAHNGIEIARQRWQPTIDYLNQQISGHAFELVPVISLAELHQRAGTGEFDFVLTNPTSYVGLELEYRASAVATLINRAGDRGVSRFGSVLFALRGRDDIQRFADIQDKHLVAVSELAFGGWQVAWYELLINGIDPYAKAGRISFADGIQSRVVEKVLSGKADIGVVRSDMLERLARAGRLDLDQVKVIQPRTVRNFPYLLSTSLYPEWAFARMPNAPPTLSKAVANALLNLPENHPAVLAGEYQGWDSPHNYQVVHELLQALEVGPYEGFGDISLGEVVEEHWPWLLIILLMLGVAMFEAVLARRSSRRLSKAKAALLCAKSTLEERVAERTQELNRFKATLDETLDCVFMFDPQDLRFIYVNAGATRQVGYGYDELMAMTAYDITPEYDR